MTTAKAGNQDMENQVVKGSQLMRNQVVKGNQLMRGQVVQGNQYMYKQTVKGDQDMAKQVVQGDQDMENQIVKGKMYIAFMQIGSSKKINDLIKKASKEFQEKDKALDFEEFVEWLTKSKRFKERTQEEYMDKESKTTYKKAMKGRLK